MRPQSESPRPEGLDLEAIEKRARAATPGPWGDDDGHVFSEPMQAVTIEWCATPNHGSKRPPDASVADCSQQYKNFEADSEFIAHARQDIPALISRIRELEGEIARLKALSDSQAQALDMMEAGRL